MNTLSYKTLATNKSTVDKQWIVIDATDQVLGRLSSEIARRIRGKHKPNFSPHVDCGDNVIVINSDKIRLTGKKREQKVYVSYSGYPGGQKTTSLKQLMAKSSTKIVERAVKGMLPKNRLGRALFGNLYVYEGAEHPHEAQQPKTVNI